MKMEKKQEIQYVTIDSIARGLKQLNESAYRLKLVGQPQYKLNKDRLDIVKEQYKGEEQITQFERIYTNLKEKEVTLGYKK